MVEEVTSHLHRATHVSNGRLAIVYSESALHHAPGDHLRNPLLGNVKLVAPTEVAIGFAGDFPRRARRKCIHPMKVNERRLLWVAVVRGPLEFIVLSGVLGPSLDKAFSVKVSVSLLLFLIRGSARDD